MIRNFKKMSDNKQDDIYMQSKNIWVLLTCLWYQYDESDPEKLESSSVELEEDQIKVTFIGKPSDSGICRLCLSCIKGNVSIETDENSKKDMYVTLQVVGNYLKHMYPRSNIKVEWVLN